MKRIFVCLLAVLLLVGCGNKSEESAAAEKDLQAIYAQMESQFPEMMKASDVMMLDLFGIKPELYLEAMLYVCADGLKVDEIWLIEAVDKESLATLKLLAENHLNSQKIIYQSYAPDQYAVLEQGVVITEGNYLALIINQNAAALAEEF